MFQLFSIQFIESVCVSTLSFSCTGGRKTYSDWTITFTEGYLVKGRH
jgi:hypothetical protein